MIKKKTIQSLYPDARIEVVDNLLKIYQYLENEYGAIKNEWKVVLSLLANNLEMFYKCQDQIKKDGILTPDRYGNLNKHSLFPVMLNLQIQILKCINELGLSPKAASKIDPKSKSREDDSTDDFINSLIQ